MATSICSIFNDQNEFKIYNFVNISNNALSYSNDIITFRDKYQYNIFKYKMKIVIILLDMSKESCRIF